MPSAIRTRMCLLFSIVFNQMRLRSPLAYVAIAACSHVESGSNVHGRGGPWFDNSGLCAGWRNDHAPGSGRPNARLIPGPMGRIRARISYRGPPGVLCPLWGSRSGVQKDTCGSHSLAAVAVIGASASAGFKLNQRHMHGQAASAASAVDTARRGVPGESALGRPRKPERSAGRRGVLSRFVACSES